MSWPSRERTQKTPSLPRQAVPVRLQPTWASSRLVLRCATLHPAWTLHPHACLPSSAQKSLRQKSVSATHTLYCHDHSHLVAIRSLHIPICIPNMPAQAQPTSPVCLVCPAFLMSWPLACRQQHQLTYTVSIAFAVSTLLNAWQPAESHACPVVMMPCCLPCNVIRACPASLPMQSVFLSLVRAQRTKSQVSELRDQRAAVGAVCVASCTGHCLPGLSFLRVLEPHRCFQCQLAQDANWTLYELQIRIDE